MKYKLFMLLLFQTILTSLSAQSYNGCDQEVLKKRYNIANSLYTEKKYGEAIKEFLAIIVICPEEAKEAGVKIDSAVKAIEKLKDDAVRSSIEADKAILEAQKATIEIKNLQTKIQDAEVVNYQARKLEKEKVELIEKLNEKNAKLLNAMYFYKDSIALAYNRINKFYYINKKGDPIEYLGDKYDQAEIFDVDGWAYVEKEKKEYLLNENGELYHAAYDIIDIDSSTQILDFRNRYINASNPIEVVNNKIIGLLLQTNGPIYESYFLTRIGSFINLKYLDLSKTRINSLPESIGNLSQLETLLLRGDGWKYDNTFVELPDCILKLKNLKTLDVRYNRLKKLPENIGDLSKLKYLNFNGDGWNSNNELQKIPESIGKLILLEELYVTDNLLTALPESIKNLTNLKKLDLSYNPISNEEIEKIKSWLPNCQVIFKK